MMTEDGCWADYRADPSTTRGCPCLFLDRDGVLIEDTGYPHDPAAIRLIAETLDVVRAANRRGFAVGVVSNQSGIGRGYFAWDAFLAVQNEIDAALAARGGHLDFVLACPHLADAPIPIYRQAHHPWRKPAPGMLIAAGAALGLDMGDRRSDMVAAADAGLRHRVLLDGEDAPDRNGAWVAVSRAGLADWFRLSLAQR